MLNIIYKTFDELNLIELYDILQLRSEVFVVEQDCVYQDIDGKDHKALHVIGYKNNKIIAYTRLFKPSDYFNESSIGRVVVKKNERSFGYGHEIVKESIKIISKEFNTKLIKISAQKYLQKFYETHDFKTIGDEYLEDGIPHIAMIRNEE